MKSTKILGNQETENLRDRLLRQAGEDKIVKEVIEGKDVPDAADISKTGLRKLRFKPCKEAEELIEGIEKDIKFYEGEGSKLISQGRMLEENILVSDNALLAIAYNILGRHNDADQIFKGIEENRGFNDLGLVKTNTIKSAYDNILLCMAHYAAFLSKRDYYGLPKAWDLERAIKANIGFRIFDDGSMLVKAGPGEPDIYTIDNILLAFAYLLAGSNENAFKIVNGIDKLRFKRFEQSNDTPRGVSKLVNAGAYAGDFDAYTSHNAMLSILYDVLGRETEALQLQEGFLRIGYDYTGAREGMLIKDNVKYKPKSDTPIQSKGFFTRDNALAAAAYLASGNITFADLLFKGIEEQIELYEGSKGGKLVNISTHERLYARTEDNVLLALAYMLREGCKDKNE